MEKFRSKTPDFHKEIQIQPIIHQEIQPVITTEIQPIIEQRIQPVVHKEIQPIIHNEIQPVIIRQIQPVILKKIQPVIFNENQANIEEIIQQMEQSQNQNNNLIIENHTNQKEVAPSTQRKETHSEKIVVKPFIMREEKHQTKRIIEPETETETKIENIEIMEYVPYIQYKDGTILPYEKKTIKKSGLENIPHTYIQKVYESNESIQNSTQMMETIIAVNFVNLSLNIHYPMACRKTDIFSSVEKKLYQIFPELKNKKYYFLANSRVIDKYLTFEQNKIKSGDTILINENYLNK